MDVIPAKEGDEYNSSTISFQSFRRGRDHVSHGDNLNRQDALLILGSQDCPAEVGLCKPSYPPSRHDWEAHREHLTRLYQVEERPLKEVMEIMKERYGFQAT
jgi:hypothetical protein